MFCIMSHPPLTSFSRSFPLLHSWLSELAPHYYEYAAKIESSTAPADKRVKRIEAENDIFRHIISGRRDGDRDKKLEHPF